MAIIDPPRGGLGEELPEILKYLSKCDVKQIILVGCKTEPWSRDIAKMISQGWYLESLAIMDFFPQTFHVETVANLIHH